MQLDKKLQHLGFQPTDYTIVGDDFIMTPKFQDVQVSPAVFDEEGELVSEAVIEQVDVTPAKPTEEQLQAAYEEVQLKECDIALLIEEYVKNCERDPENDCINIVDGLLHSFSFTHIVKPTNAQLLALKSAAEVKSSQEQINKEAEQYLAKTDWLILRAWDSGVAIPDGVQLLRQQARDRIVRS